MTRWKNGVQADMSDYIKREDAKNAVINVVGWESIANYLDEMSKHFSTKDNYYYDALMDAEDAIDDLPSEDVAPVRHGRWITDEEDDGWVWSKCSECGYHMLATHRYCPNCGARMDGEK